MNNTIIKGRGAQKNTHNPFLKNKLVQEFIEGLDEEYIEDPTTRYFFENPKNIINRVDSPDLGLAYSMNPYQGCEHGCIYCYARNSHQYWGYSAGLDFEKKIIVKENAPNLLEDHFDKRSYIPSVIMLSGNTDCYQPVEKKLKITRRILEVFLKYENPVSIITKNSLILRDLDLLSELNKYDLIQVSVSITSLNEDLRQKLEPRTATAANRLKVVNALSSSGIPVNIMVAPIIPSLNSHEIPEILKAAGHNGASSAGYTVVRLNGSIGEIFEDWINKTYPDRSEKVLNQIKECHGGKLNDSRYGVRMKGEGNFSKEISDLFHWSANKYLNKHFRKDLSLAHFKRPEKGQLSIF